MPQPNNREEMSDSLCKRLGKNYFYYTRDIDSNFTFISSGITSILGYSPDEFSANFSDYLTDESPNKNISEHSEQTLLGNVQPSYLIELVKKEGSSCWLEINEHPCFDSQGKVIGLEGIARDISENKQYENALKHVIKRAEHQDTLQSALDAIDAGVFSYDVVNDKAWWNKKSYQLFSVTPESFPNTYSAWRELVVEEDIVSTEETFRAALAGQEDAFQVEYRIYINHTDIRWINVKAQISRNKQGKAIWVDGLYIDATKTKKLEYEFLESENRFRSLVENSPDWIWETDTHGEYTYTSPYVEQLLGYKTEEVLGQTLFSFMPGEERLRLVDIFQQHVQQQQPFANIESIACHKDGTQIIFETNASPILNSEGEFIGYRGVHRDITAQRVTSKLETDKEIAELANKSKSEFLANMSHELRTPMHAILSFSKFGIKKINTASPEKLLSYFEKINLSGERLLSLLNDLLDLSKLEAGKLEFNFISSDLSTVLQQCTSLHEAQFHSGQMSINIQPPTCDTTAQFDPVKIAQVITNFLSNSIKFSPPGSTLTINIEANELFSDYGITPGLCLSITDQGVGIPNFELEQIFDKFVQSSKTKTNAGGTGLGLSICKEFIDAHHGRIWAEHNPEGGAIFNFVIPLEQSNTDQHD